MKLYPPTVAQKIAGGYLLVTCFCLAAVIYALLALSTQTNKSRELATIDFTAMGLARELRSSLLAQERLEKQLLILRDAELAGILRERMDEFKALWQELAEIPVNDGIGSLEGTVPEFIDAGAQQDALIRSRSWEEAEEFSDAAMTPLRIRLLGQLEQFLARRNQAVDATLRFLSRHSNEAYRITLLLAFVGIGLAALVASRVIYRLHQTVGKLASATREIAAGSFDYPIEVHSRDEFGELARDFADMGQKLKELDRQRLDANPLTQLPGNLAIERELEKRVAEDKPFGHIYVDLDHFKAYNDRYGYPAGSDVISKTGSLIQETVRQHGNPEDMVGHVGGDDYIVLSTPERSEAIADALVTSFDRMVPAFYSIEDRQRGHIVSQDRFGIERNFPLLTMSVAVVTSQSLKDPSSLAIGRECAKMKEYLKKLPGSNYLIDRREMR